MEDQRIRVLLVEDDSVDREAIARHVVASGLPYELRTAASRAEALARLRESTFDVVLLDYMLGDGTGLEILAQLGDTPAVVITGSGSEQTAVEAMRRGALDYLVKDTANNYLTVLPLTIRNVLERRGAQVKLRESVAMLRNIYENSPVMMHSIDEQGRFCDVNRRWLEEMGYTREEVIGRKVDFLMTPESAHRAFSEVIPRFWRQGSVRDIPYEVVRKDGTIIDVLVDSNATHDPSGKPISLSVVRNVTERKRAEERVAASLREKEVLLREIHHRVKNNMQSVISLLRLQARRMTSQPAIEALTGSQNRIKAMALIHETLFQSEDLAGIALPSYLNRLIKNLSGSLGARGRAVKITADVGAATLDVDTAVPVGLIINELVSNALRHAFPEGRRGKIAIAVHPVGQGELEIEVRDDGVGLPETVDPHRAETLGLRLVVRMAEDQLGGRLEVVRSGGTCCKVRFRPRASGSHLRREIGDRG